MTNVPSCCTTVSSSASIHSAPSLAPAPMASFYNLTTSPVSVSETAHISFVVSIVCNNVVLSCCPFSSFQTVDENRTCSPSNACEQLCVLDVNATTSASTETCLCENGYELDGNGRNCTGTYMHTKHLATKSMLLQQQDTKATVARQQLPGNSCQETVARKQLPCNTEHATMK